MTENMTTLNTSQEITESSAVADTPAFNPNSTGLIYDRDETYTEIDTSDKTLNPETEEQEEGKTEQAKEDGDTQRFDKHPRWQEMKQERDQARQLAEQERLEKARLEGELNALRRTSEYQPETTRQPLLAFKDINTLTADEIAEWQVTDPKGYAANLKEQAKYEVMREVQSALKAEQAAEQSRISIERTYKEFEEKNPDFKTMWDSGAIIKYIESNPGHNPISAYQAMTYDSRMQKAIEDARLKAIKETEERVNKNWQAKKSARVLGAGPAGNQSDTEDKEFMNIKEKGGLYSFLANRLEKRKAASQ